MSGFLYRLGHFGYSRPLVFVTLWVLVLGGTIALAVTGGGRISTSLTIDGTPSQQVTQELHAKVPAAGGGQGTLVFTVPGGETLTEGPQAAAIGRVADQVGGLDVVVAHPAGGSPATGPTSPAGESARADVPPPGTAAAPAGGAGAGAAGSVPYRPLVVDGAAVPDVLVSADATVAMLAIQFTSAVDDLPAGSVDHIVGLAEQGVAGTGLTVLPSSSLETLQPPIGAHDAIGLVVALVVLLLTLGSLWAAGLPVLSALVGVGIGLGGAFALSSTITLTTATPALALMVGLAVGIDYSLFIVHRQRRLILAAGLPAAEATARAVATAGTAVVFAGATVVIALVGLTVIGVGFLTTMALVAAGTVALAVLVATTLLPSVLGLVGERICSASARRAGLRPRVREERRPARRWGGVPVRRPWPVIATVVVVLGLLAIPAAAMRLGMPTGATDNRSSSARQAYDAVARGFGPGFNAPLVVVAQPESGTGLTPAEVGGITAGLRHTPDVTEASVKGLAPDSSLAVFTVIPAGGPNDASTADLVRTLRDGPAWADQAQVSLGVTGLTATDIDISDRMAAALPEYLAIIVGLSLVLLLLVFRSLLIPLTATLGFLLSIAATFGITTAVFQWGWLGALVGIDTPGPMLSFLPIMVTGILYGLAMDYQVFLVSSMREARSGGMGSHRAITHGFAHSSRVVVAAATIMVSVFASFVLSDDPMVKQFGFALAVGVVVDAFAVRLTLVPAVLRLLGEAAWWVPRWLAPVLPRLDVDGGRPGGGSDGRAGAPPGFGVGGAAADLATGGAPDPGEPVPVGPS